MRGCCTRGLLRRVFGPAPRDLWTGGCASPAHASQQRLAAVHPALTPPHSRPAPPRAGYTINSSKVIFLRRRPQPRPPKGAVGASLCTVCSRHLQDVSQYCSLQCKMDAQAGVKHVSLRPILAAAAPGAPEADAGSASSGSSSGAGAPGTPSHLHHLQRQAGGASSDSDCM